MNAKIKAALTLLYFAVVGFSVDFFFYFTPFEFTADMHDATSLMLSEACLNGTIEGGAFSYIFSLFLLLFMLVITIIVSVKTFKQSDFNIGFFVAPIIIGVLCLVLAIVQLSIFTKLGYGSTHNSGDSITVKGGAEFLFLYISSFEAAGTSILAGIIGIMGVKEGSFSFYSNKPKYTVNHNYQKSSNSFTGTNSQQPISGNSEFFQVGDIVVCRFPSGTTISELKDGELVFEKIEHDSELEILSLSTDKRKGSIKRISDGHVFEETNMYPFILKSSNISKQPEVKHEESAEVIESKRIKLLKEYKQLLDDGVISQEEFEKKKKQLL